jgi:hypothetical protein
LHEPISAIAPTEERAAQVDSAVKRQDWTLLANQHEWDPSKDALCYWFVECPERHRGALYRVESRAVLDQDDRIEMVAVLDQVETERFFKALPPENPLSL